MSVKNDKLVLQLRKKVDAKRKALELSKRFTPVTNCSLDLDGKRINIQVLTKGGLIGLLVKLTSYRTAADTLGLTEDYIIAGYNIKSWIDDVAAKLAYLTRKDEGTKLQLMEQQLETLLSNDKKVELELQSIADSLKE